MDQEPLYPLIKFLHDELFLIPFYSFCYTFLKKQSTQLKKKKKKPQMPGLKILTSITRNDDIVDLDSIY